MTSQSIGSPKPKQSYFVSQKSELMAWQPKVCSKRAVLKNPGCRVLWHKPQNHLLWCSGAFIFNIFEDFKQLVLSPPSLYMCGSDPRIYHFLEFTECVRGENRNQTSSSETYPNFAKKPKRNLFLFNKPSKIDPSEHALQGRYIDDRDNGVPEALGNVHVRLYSSFGLNPYHTDWVSVWQPMLIAWCIVSLI